MRWCAWAAMAALTVALGACAQKGTPRVAAAQAPGHEDHGAHADAAGQAPDAALDADDRFAFARRGPQPTPIGRQGVWLAFSNHNHSTYWDGKKPLTVLQQEAILKNLDALALTDHNTMRGTRSPEFLVPPPGLVMVRGMEWNAFREHGDAVVGHAGLLGMQDDAPMATGMGLNDMLAEATRRQATVVINHPFLRGNRWTQAKPDPRVHAVEVWNGWWSRIQPLMNNHEALAWWDQALRDGRRLTATSGTDCHGQWYEAVDRVVTMVFASEPTEAALLEGFRAGRATITASPTAGRLYLEADANGDGHFEAMMGDVVAPPASGRLKVRARVLGGSGKQVVFYTATGRQSIQTAEGADATVAFEVKLRPGRDFVRAELRAHPHLSPSMTAIANPIYVGEPIPVQDRIGQR